MQETQHYKNLDKLIIRYKATIKILHDHGEVLSIKIRMYMYLIKQYYHVRHLLMLLSKKALSENYLGKNLKAIRV